MWGDIAPYLGILLGVPGGVAIVFIISRAGHKKKELELREKELEMRGSDPELDALREDLNDTRAQLSEMQEHLDFTERMLAAGPASQEDKSG